MALMVQVYIDGQTGTTALQIKDKLANIAEVELFELADADRKNTDKRAAAINAAEFVFLCLPDDAAREAVSLITNPDVRIIDASTAHRINPDWAFGLPELSAEQAAKIKQSKRVANPGCFSTGAILLLAPLVRNNTISADESISIFGVSGYTGGGKGMISQFEDAADDGFAQNTFRQYSLGNMHKHVPEIKEFCGLNNAPIFTPSVGSFAQGMIITIPLHLDAGQNAKTVRDLLTKTYINSNLVQVVAQDDTAAFIEANKTAISDDVMVRVYDGNEAGQVILTAQFDNLGKGASGAAVQNFKLMAGLV
ncbi:MAG: N-acetyl-gamma-glutamyl-phosphate reductase [Hyphomicrobiales bacterium]